MVSVVSVDGKVKETCLYSQHFGRGREAVVLRGGENGGVDKQCASKLQAVDGACVVSAIMAAQDPHAAARELRGAFVQVPRVLSIAGTDPTGGAGAQADVKSITAAGGYGMNVVTALVAQNTHGVRSVHTPPLEFLDEQLDAVFSDVAVDAIKIGMLATVDTIATVQAWLDMYPSPVVVLDPVMIATSGDRLIDADAEQALRQLARREGFPKQRQEALARIRRHFQISSSIWPFSSG